MRVILRENIENLGRKGDIVDVAAGYGRNFLIPKKLALEVTPSNMKMIEMEQQTLRKKFNQEKATYKDLIDELNETRLTFIRKTAEKDVIFGSVSSADIREALSEQGMEVDKKKVLLDEPIKRLGNYTVPVKVFHDERAEVKIEVITDEEAATKEEKEKTPEEIKERTEEVVEELKKEEPPDKIKEEKEIETAEAEEKKEEREETAETVIVLPEEEKGKDIIEGLQPEESPEEKGETPETVLVEPVEGKKEETKETVIMVPEEGKKEEEEGQQAEPPEEKEEEAEKKEEETEQTDTEAPNEKKTK